MQHFQDILEISNFYVTMVKQVGLNFRKKIQCEMEKAAEDLPSETISITLTGDDADVIDQDTLNMSLENLWRLSPPISSTIKFSFKVKTSANSFNLNYDNIKDIPQMKVNPKGSIGNSSFSLIWKQIAYLCSLNVETTSVHLCQKVLEKNANEINTHIEQYSAGIHGRGVAQNLVQLEAVTRENAKCKHEDDTVYGIVTNGTSWLFIAFSDHDIISTSQTIYHISFDNLNNNNITSSVKREKIMKRKKQKLND
ncbi:6809_t:CDS:2 [Entrophospora sp. SA101]|nr:6809_t:CDS:2 [Entrophospora sp. SA101]CAJ0843458.1 2644_t:CDS:2 [Entrophospora sp. SA101]